jgi:hypothetical protein
VQTKTSIYTLRADGLVEQRVRSGIVRQSLEDARENVAAFIQVADGQKRGLLVDLRVNIATEDGVRQYYAGPEAARLCVASALLVESASGRIVGNFFISLSRPPFPTRMFTVESEAVSWLALTVRRLVPSAKAEP